MFTRIEAAYRHRTAVIIGAGGIGAAILKLLAGTVGQLVVADRDESLLTQLQAEFGSERFHIHPLDVRDPAAVARLFTELDQTVGAPDYLFYTAGILNIEPFAETSPELWTRAIEINLSGAFYTVKEAAERMQEQQRGSILILSSIAGIKARSGSRVNPVYNTTKAGLSAFVNASAMQLRPHGVRINCISPGPTETPMMAIQPATVHDAVHQITLDHRMNTPDEVAELALFIAAHGRFTGEDLAMGGGAGLGG